MFGLLAIPSCKESFDSVEFLVEIFFINLAFILSLINDALGFMVIGAKLLLYDFKELLIFYFKKKSFWI